MGSIYRIDHPQIQRRNSTSGRFISPHPWPGHHCSSVAMSRTSPYYTNSLATRKPSRKTEKPTCAQSLASQLSAVLVMVCSHFTVQRVASVPCGAEIPRRAGPPTQCSRQVLQAFCRLISPQPRVSWLIGLLHAACRSQKSIRFPFRCNSPDAVPSQAVWCSKIARSGPGYSST